MELSLKNFRSAHNGQVGSCATKGVPLTWARSPLRGHLPPTVALRFRPSDAQTELEPWSLGQVLAAAQSYNRVCQNPRFQPPPAVMKTRCLASRDLWFDSVTESKVCGHARSEVSVVHTSNCLLVK